MQVFSQNDALDLEFDNVGFIANEANMSCLNNEKIDIKHSLIQTPLNYTGSKFKLLPSILPLFSKNISTMLDLFCGGASVGINTKAKNIILNDKSKELMGILHFFKQNASENILEHIFRIIDEFKLSNSFKFGYKFYHCNSSQGLANYNKQGFSHLKVAYNESKNPLLLFVLIIFSFNNQIRFNSKGEFNLPCGKRDFNARMQEKLICFVRALHSKNIRLENKDFRDFDISILDKNTLVYIDPPYFLAKATYNENKGWGQDDEKDLLEFIKILDDKNIKFALSNVLFHKGKEHLILKNWLDKNPNFKTHFLKSSYKNCNYQTKREESSEVLIVNQ